MTDATTTDYALTEEDRQLLLCAAGELAAARPDLTHKLTHIAYRLQGITQFEEFHERAKRQWISVPAQITDDITALRFNPPHGPHRQEIGRIT
jgi:hypothetical protein